MIHEYMIFLCSLVFWGDFLQWELECLWLFCLFLRHISSYWISSSSPDMKFCVWSYGKLWCCVWWYPWKVWYFLKGNGGAVVLGERRIIKKKKMAEIWEGYLGASRSEGSQDSDFTGAFVYLLLFSSFFLTTIDYLL